MMTNEDTVAATPAVSGMSFDLDSFTTCPKLANEGVRFYPGGVESEDAFWIGIRATSYEPFQAELASGMREIERNPLLAADKEKSVAAQKALGARAIGRHLITGWGNLVDKGIPVVHTASKAEATCLRVDKFTDMVMSYAKEIENFREDKDSASLGN